MTSECLSYQVSRSLGPILISRFILNLRRSLAETSTAGTGPTLQEGASSAPSQRSGSWTMDFVSGGISSDLSGLPADFSSDLSPTGTIHGAHAELDILSPDASDAD